MYNIGSFKSQSLGDAHYYRFGEDGRDVRSACAEGRLLQCERHSPTYYSLDIRTSEEGYPISHCIEKQARKFVVTTKEGLRGYQFLVTETRPASKIHLIVP